MQIAIKRPQKGQKVRLDEFGVVGIVTEVIGFTDAFSWQVDIERRDTNKELRARLGSDFEALYFECVVTVVDTKEENGRYKKGDTLRVTWDEVQKGEFVY